jgi:hypothetical protein
VRHPALLRALAAVWRLPVTDLRVRQADADAWWFRHWFRLRRRLAWAVLDLPAAEEHYLVGRPRQALRTNLRHADAVGVTSSRVTYETWFEAVSAVLRARDDKPGPEQDPPGPGQEVAYYVARDAQGTALAFVGAALFGQFAVLFALVSRPDMQPATSWARYQLHTFLVFDLGRYGVEHLLTGSALRVSAGEQYFQHLLGYQPRNLRVEMIRSPERFANEGPQHRDPRTRQDHQIDDAGGRRNRPGPSTGAARSGGSAPDTPVHVTELSELSEAVQHRAAAEAEIAAKVTAARDAGQSWATISQVSRHVG